MACHTLPLRKAKHRGKMPLPSLSPIPSPKSTFLTGMGLRQAFPLFLCFFEGWSMTSHPFIFRRIYFPSCEVVEFKDQTKHSATVPSLLQGKGFQTLSEWWLVVVKSSWCIQGSAVELNHDYGAARIFGICSNNWIRIRNCVMIRA